MKFEFKLRSLILISVITTISLSVIGITWIVFERLQEAILHGFDRKLSAVCTVTSAFMDARTHERILAPRKIEAMAVDPSDGTIYGADSSFGTSTLVRIDPATGEAEGFAFLEQCPISLAIGQEKGTALALLAGDDDTASLVTIDLENGEFGEPSSLPPGSRAIAFHPTSGVLHVGGKGVWKFPAGADEEGAMVDGTAAMIVDEMDFTDDRTLVTFHRESHQLTRFDIVDGKILAARFMPLQEAYESVLVGPALAIARSQEPGQLLAATDRLIRVDAESLNWDDRNMVPGFRSEQAPLYRRYVEPMRSIKDRMDLTFLYTQTLSNTGEVLFDGAHRERMNHPNVNRIIYVLDSNTDDDHSEIGYYDAENPADESIRDVYYKGGLYLSEIEEWERWGLIKSGFAPIQESDGQIIAMAGADVSVEKIREKTKFALSKVTLAGLGAILLASLVSIAVARKLTAPIEALKDVALRIAAGQFGEKVGDTNLLELSRLSESFNIMSRKLEATVKGLTESNREWELDRRHHELIRHLTLRNADLNRFDTWVELLTAGQSHHSASGWTNHGAFVVGWIAPDQGSRAANLRFRTGLAAFLYQMIDAANLDREEVQAHVRRYLGGTENSIFLADLENRKFEFHVSGHPVLWSFDPESGAAEEPLESGLREIERGKQYVVCGDPELAANLTRWAESRDGEDLVSLLQTRLREESDDEGESSCGIALSLKPENPDIP